MCRNRATLCRTSSSSPCLPLPLMGVIRRRQDTPLSKTLSHFMYRLVRSLYYHRIDFPVSIRAVESCFNIILDSLVAYDFPEQKSIPFVTQGNRLYTNTQTHTHIYIYKYGMYRMYCLCTPIILTHCALFMLGSTLPGRPQP